MRNLLVRIAGVAACWIALMCSLAGIASAQTGTLQLAGGSDAKLDVAKPTDPAAPEPKPAKKTEAGLGQRGDRDVTVADQLSFREEQVHGEMSELEQRMFRLSEALKKLEPENSSRLMVGLKYAREELILHRMKRKPQEALGEVESQGRGRRTEGTAGSSRTIATVAALGRSRFRNADRAVASHPRHAAQARRRDQGGESRREIVEALRRQGKGTGRTGQLPRALQELVKQQTEHVAANTPLAKQDKLGDDERAAVGKLATGQEATYQAAKALSADASAGGASPSLTEAGEHMQSAVDALAKTAPAEALPPMEKALESLKKELEEVAKKEAEAKAALNKDKFAAMKKEQEANRGATDQVAEMTRGLGNNGTTALEDLTKAGEAMASAEGAFGNSQAGQGNGAHEQGQGPGSAQRCRGAVGRGWPVNLARHIARRRR